MERLLTRASWFPLALMSLLPGCSLQPCENEILGQAISPDGKLAAVIFNRSCGVTTGFTFQISIVRRGELPKGVGNAVVMEDVPDYSDVYKPVWPDSSHVVVPIPKNV